MKSITEVLKAIIAKLDENGCIFAISGGLAATLYRDEQRLTADIDLAVAFKDELIPLAKLRDIIEELGYNSSVIREADLLGGPAFKIKDKSSEQVIIVGRSKEIPIGLDLLLPALPWVIKAVERAQSWKVDFGFGPIPCLTVEDVLLAKFTACSHKEERFKDLDDIQSIFRSDNSIDLAYLTAEMRRLNIPAPKSLFKFIPAALVSLSKEMIRGK